jgi:hypothetical protein
VCADSIEADRRLASLGEIGCRLAHVELGCQPENRLRISVNSGSCAGSGAGQATGALAGSSIRITW